MKFGQAITAALLLIAILGTSGCATVVVNGIRQTEKSPGLEIRSNGAPLDGSYIGNEEIDGQLFAKIIVFEPRATCEDRSPIEMLLPLTSEKTARPLLKEVNEATLEKGKPVKVIIDPFDKTKAEKLVKEEPWPGYPENIIFRHEFEDSPSVFYRFGPALSDLRQEGIEEKLKWVCRSRAVYLGSTILLPFAVSFDIVTFPVQLVITVAFGH